jgi:hypothetical protein
VGADEPVVVPAHRLLAAPHRRARGRAHGAAITGGGLCLLAGVLLIDHIGAVGCSFELSISRPVDRRTGKRDRSGPPFNPNQGCL